MDDYKLDKYIVNNYRNKKIGDKILITTDNGSWVFLNEEEFGMLKKDNVSDNLGLFNLLEDKGVIVTEKNKSDIIDLWRKRYHYLIQGTSLHIVIPTLRCNQKCVYCHASSKPINAKEYDMDEKTAKAIVDFIFQSPSKGITIEFQGGEPLLRFDIVKYITEYAKKLNEIYKKNLFLSIVTNLTLMDEEKLNYLIENGISICTSFDGPDFLHNKNRGFFCNAGTYSYVNKWVKRIQEEYEKRKIGNRKANALITITKDSLKYPREIIDEYLKLKLTDIHLRFLNNLGDARKVWGEINYSSEEFINFWKKSMDYILEINKKGYIIRERAALIILRKIFTGVDPNYMDMRSPCGAIIGQMAYTPKGDIFSCDEARMISEDLFKLGNVEKNSYKDILSSEQTCSIVSSSINDCQICDFCVYKPYCGICPVCNYAEQGSIIVKIPKTARCKIYKAQFTYLFSRLQDLDNKKIFLSWLEPKKSN